MSYTAAFIKKSGDLDSSPRLLVEIVLTSPSSKTLRLSYTDIGVAGTPYHGVLESSEPIEEPGQFIPTSYDVCSWHFSMLDQWLPGQPPDVTASLLLSQYRFRGAAVTAIQWDPGLEAPDKATMFVGEINGYETMRGLITFDCVQRRDWNKTLPAERVERWKYPRAPERNLGRIIPTLIGRGRAQVLRGDFARNLGASRNNFDHHGGAIPSVRGTLVDMGRGGTTKGRVLVAAHALSSIGAGSSGTNFFGANDSSPMPSVVNPAGGDILNAATGSGFLIPDESAVTFMPVLGTEVKAGLTNPADNPRGILDGQNEATYAKFDYTNNLRNLVLQLPNVSPAGRLVDIWILFGYKSEASVGAFKFVFQGPSSEQSWSPVVSSAVIEAFQVSNAHWPSNPWDLQSCVLRAEFQGVSAGVGIRVHCLGVIIQYQPGVMKRQPVTKAHFAHVPTPSVPRPGAPRDIEVVKKAIRVAAAREISELDDGAEFYCNGDGPNDDGSGTYTGAASALIVRAPDIAHYLLRTYCGQSAGQVETATGALGSFADARAAMLTWNQRTMEYFLAIDAESQAVDTLQQLARDSVSAFHLGRSDGKARWTSFVTNPSTTFPRKIEPEDVVDLGLLRFRTMGDQSLITSVRLSYLFNAAKNEFIGEAFCSPSASRAGYQYLGLRDESMTVVASESDRLDFSSTAGAATANLTAGEYQPWNFAKHVKAQMDAASTDDFIVNYGPRIETGYNDKLDINDGANKTATVAQADYATFEALCVAVAAALNAVSSSWTCTYDRPTRKVTIDRTAGTKTIRGTSGPNTTTSILGALGMTNNSAAAPRTSECEVEEQRFVVSDATGNSLLLPFETGTNGANAATPRTCGALLGFPIDRDATLVSSNTSCYSGLCPKAAREYVLEDVVAKYGSRRPYTLAARTILDSDTAREVRNRLIDLGAQPRPIVGLRSFRLRDLERYHVVELSSRFDQFLRYPEDGTDGSWAGKKFWAINLRHNVGPDRWDSEAMLVRAS